MSLPKKQVIVFEDTESGLKAADKADRVFFASDPDREWRDSDLPGNF